MSATNLSAPFAPLELLDSHTPVMTYRAQLSTPAVAPWDELRTPKGALTLGANISLRKSAMTPTPPVCIKFIWVIRAIRIFTLYYLTSYLFFVNHCIVNYNLLFINISSITHVALCLTI